MKLKLSTPCFLVGNLKKQVCTSKMFIFPTINQRVLSLSLVKTMIHKCARDAYSYAKGICMYFCFLFYVSLV